MYIRTLKILKSNSFFLFGPRGSGKTTYLKNFFKNDKVFWIDLLDPKTEDKYLLNPEILLEEASAISSGWIVIDEVQKNPNLLNIVHKLIETKELKFALTGSSARKLKRGAANLLAGRAFVYSLYSLDYLELGNNFDIKSVLTWGSLPKIFSFSEDQEKELFLDSYCHTYLKEEVVAEQLVRNLKPFRKFLDIVAKHNSEIINYSKFAREIGVDDKTVTTYYEILEDTLIGFYLTAYNKSLRKQFIKSPKFYLFDCGVTRALSNVLHLPLEKATFQYGKLFEQFIILEIYKLNLYFNKKFKLHYFQSKDGVEIDLVVERPGSKRKFIEIKSSNTIRSDKISNLISFSKEFKETDCICLCQTEQESIVEGVRVLPWKKGIKEVLEID